MGPKSARYWQSTLGPRAVGSELGLSRTASLIGNRLCPTGRHLGHTALERWELYCVHRYGRRISNASQPCGFAAPSSDILSEPDSVYLSRGWRGRRRDNHLRGVCATCIGARRGTRAALFAARSRAATLPRLHRLHGSVFRLPVCWHCRRPAVPTARHQTQRATRSNRTRL